MAGEKMLALVLRGPKQVELATVDKPALQHPTDCIVRVSLCGICGSDLHVFHDREKGLHPGTIVGHEFTGVVEQVGPEVKQLRPGDRVMSAFTTSCGSCFFCERGVTCRCSHEQGGACFGWVSAPAGGGPPAGVQGSQAQYVRVPLADGTLLKVPEGLSDEQCILLGDILSTAFFCADQGGVGPGDAVAVLGCGPVGLLAVLAARRRGARAVVAVDGVPERRAKAEAFGARAADPAGAAAAVAAATGGRGADVALELVGSASALRLAFDLLRPAGVLSSIGVHTDAALPFSPAEAYDKNLTYRSGRCPARVYAERLLPMMLGRGEGGGGEGGRPFTDVVTHRLPLSRGVEGYRMFDEKLDGCIKVVLDPWAALAGAPAAGG